jgi:hypothetical protein
VSDFTVISAEELAALQRDAERYRLIRQTPWLMWQEDRRFYRRWEQVDAAVDEMLASGNIYAGTAKGLIAEGEISLA